MKNWLKENWLRFIINFIGIYIILLVSFSLLFELQKPDLLRLFTTQELENYTNESLISLQVERQNEFLSGGLLFSAFFLTIGVYLFRFKKEKNGRKN